MSRLSCEIVVTPISFMARSISVRMPPSAFSTSGCPARGYTAAGAEMRERERPS
jgi:hypothetical protein